MIRKREKFWGGSEKQSALELRWHLAADCSKGGFQPPEMHNRQQGTAVCCEDDDHRRRRLYSAVISSQLSFTFEELEFFSPFLLLWPWLWPDDLHIQTWPVFLWDIMDVQKWTSYVKVFEIYCLTDWQTPLKLYILPLCMWSVISRRHKLITLEAAAVTDYRRHCHTILPLWEINLKVCKVR